MLQLLFFSAMLASSTPTTAQSKSDEVAQWVLVGVTSATALFIWYQAWQTKRAAESTRDSVKAINRQAAIMERQSLAAEDNAKAARENAEAAKRSIDLVISKERARLAIEVDPLTWASPFLPPLDEILDPINYRLRFFGYTPAFIIDSSVSAFMHSDTKPFRRPVTSRIPCPSVIASQADLGGFTIDVLPATFPNPLTLSVEQLKAIRSGEVSVIFRGFIRYRDAFEGITEIRFSYAWSESGIPMLNGQWKMHGSPEDNRETYRNPLAASPILGKIDTV